MLDKWFIEDIKAGLKQADRLVVIDEQGQCGFLVPILEKAEVGTVFQVADEIEDLRAKYMIEKNYADKPAIVFTTISLDDLKFVREYCETGGCLHISHLHRYIVQKINEKIGFDLVAAPEKIIAIGKLSIGKKKDYWDRVRGSDEVFTAEDVLEFLEAPEKIYISLGKEEQRLFCEYLSQFTRYPLAKKPPQAIAEEMATTVFDHIAYQKEEPFLDRLYRKWIDSKKYEDILKKYIERYQLPDDVDMWSLPNHHPFEEVDRAWLSQLIDHIKDIEWIKEKLPIFKKRAEQGITEIIGINYWIDIYNLFSYQHSQLDQIHSLPDTIEHYQKSFYKVDQAIRKLYTQFLAERTILKPIQGYYQQLVALFLDKWFSYFVDQYQETQTGLLKEIISKNDPPITIIVGDAIAFEVAQEIVEKIKSDYKVNSQVICGNYPSETDRNMNSLFGLADDNNKLVGKREKALLEQSNKEILFMQLDDVSIGHEAKDYTILYSRDVDEISERQNQKALKYYNEFIVDVRNKIDVLFGCGYKKIFLISDHGFVLTGILEESHKVEFEIEDGQKNERFCVSMNKIQSPKRNIIEIRKPYQDHEYLYFSRTIHPFKTKGSYGFAHGGISPQELLVPFIEIEKTSEDLNKLKITILNKKDLAAVVGDFFQVKIKAGSHEGDAFSSYRKIQVIFIKNKREFNQSDIFQINAEQEIFKEFATGESDEFELIIIDTESKKTLDSCIVKKQLARDLGGLGGRR